MRRATASVANALANPIARASFDDVARLASPRVALTHAVTHAVRTINASTARGVMNAWCATTRGASTSFATRARGNARARSGAKQATAFAGATAWAWRDLYSNANAGACLEKSARDDRARTSNAVSTSARRGDASERAFGDRARTVARAVHLALAFAPLALLAPILLREGWTWGNELWYGLLRRVLEAQGPAFIKWGQWASTRYDVFPAAMCHELETLQSGAPEHSWKETKKILDRAYGVDEATQKSKYMEIFEWFDEKPLASGSVAQIHRARLKPGVAEEHLTATHLILRLTRAVGAGVELVMSGEISRAARGMLEEWRDGAAGIGREVERLVNGQIRRGGQKREVAVKIRHPGVVDALTRDFEILVWMAGWSKNIKWLEPLQLENTIQQFGVHMLQQVDFRHEAENLDKFRKSFLLMPAISFPTPIPGLATEEILVETYEQGVSIASYLLSPEAAKDQLGSPQNKELAGLGVKTLFKMLIDDNFLHADLHPGNILVRLPNGMAHTLSTIAGARGNTKTSEIGPDGIVASFLHSASPEIIILDTGLATRLTPFHQASLAKMFQAIVSWDGSTVAESILSFADNAKSNVDYSQFKREIQAAVDTFRQSTPRAGECMGAIFETVQKNGLCLDPNVMIAVVTVMVLEGWQWRLDPTVNILDYLDDVLKASARKFARMAIADYASRDMWSPFSEPNYFSTAAADPMRALTHAQEDNSGAVYGMA